MRRLKKEDFVSALAVVALLIASAGCKHTRKKADAQPVVEEALFASMISVADPRSAPQLISGFYDVEGGAWRWTARTFRASLGAPRDAAQKGGTLVLRFAIPDPVIEKLQSITLNSQVNGTTLPPEEYKKSGDFIYRRDVPAAVFTSDKVQADFILDKALPPGPSDSRELGVIVRTVGFELK